MLAERSHKSVVTSTNAENTKTMFLKSVNICLNWDMWCFLSVQMSFAITSLYTRRFGGDGRNDSISV